MRLDSAKIGDQRFSRELGNRASELHAGRPAAHHDEGEHRRLILQMGGILRLLECQ
jgi:hypothetical protein